MSSWHDLVPIAWRHLSFRMESSLMKKFGKKHARVYLKSLNSLSHISKIGFKIFSKKIFQIQV